MEQKRFALIDVLSLSTAAAFGYVCFLSRYFYSFGNLKESVSSALVITVSLAGSIYIARLLKQSKRKFKISKIFEGVFLLLFTGLTFYFTLKSFTHYFSVLNRESQIRLNLNNSISLAQSMFSDYEAKVKSRLDSYSQELTTIVKSQGGAPEVYKQCFGTAPTPPDSTKIQIKIASLRADLLPTNYSDSVTRKGIKEIATGWLEKAKEDVRSWKSIPAVKVANEVEKKAQSWKDQLQKYYKKQDNWELQGQNNYAYYLKFDEVKRDFTETEKPTLLAIGLAMGAYLLMLSSWIVAKRDYRSSTKIAPYEVVL